MTSPRSHAELVTLRKLAQDLAAQRKERLSSVHLLAAIALRGGPAADLLRDRRLDDEALLKATRSVDDEGPDPIGRAMGGARDVAKRATAKEPAALHLLLALLSDRSSAAHRALTQSGVDLARLRTSALQIALGVVQARRSSPPRAGQDGGAPGAPEKPAAPARTSPARRARGEAAEPARAPAELRPVKGAGVAVPEPRPGRGAGLAATELRPAKGTGPGVTVPLFPPPRPRPVAAPAGGDAPPFAEPAAALAAALRRASTADDAAASTAVPAVPPAGRPLAAPASSVAARFTLDRARFPALASLGHNLSLAAAQGELEPIVGREREIEQALDVLAKRHANNPCLLGPAGVGKTSVARGIAHRLAFEEREPRVVVELVPSELIAGTGARGALSERLAALRSELREAGGRVILFIDGLSELFGSGALDEAMAELKLALARGEITLIGTATPEEYRKSIEVDPALARRFTIVEIDEPEEDEAFLLLRSVAVGLGAHHGLAFTDEALASAVAWSVRYLPGRALPDKALSILDLAGARTRRRAMQSAPGARAALRQPSQPSQPARQVSPAEVAEVVAELADLPVERLLETDRERMLALETLLAERVVGHGEALARIARVLRRNAAGLRARRPIGSFLLLGPTGVGKTETAKAIAESLFHSPDAMTRLDFSEYAESHAVARLVGAPPGYVGHEAGGQLTEAVRRRPYQVVLLDEIEKAHRDVLEAFLQVFDEGRLTDGRGRRVDFTNTVIVMTSNLGAAEAGALKAERSVGFARAAQAVSPERLSEAMLAATRAALPPELYNRIDEVICFAPLTRADVAEITRRLLGGLERELEARGVVLEVEPEAIDALLDAGGFDPELGARPMKRTISRLIEAPLADLILRGQLEEGSAALVGVEQGEVVVDAIARAGERRYAACSS
ncbi:ATP-dependent Clp protease ATP-binding subunit [Sorangium sp. So ce291]|uniref:AAA family ATPase n=1 Tax=Sorangium sp. So ce291 TaxID=3133294 RepID=UPI003F5DA362